MAKMGKNHTNHKSNYYDLKIKSKVKLSPPTNPVACKSLSKYQTHFYCCQCAARARRRKTQFLHPLQRTSIHFTPAAICLFHSSEPSPASFVLYKSFTMFFMNIQRTRKLDAVARLNAATLTASLTRPANEGNDDGDDDDDDDDRNAATRCH